MFERRTLLLAGVPVVLTAAALGAWLLAVLGRLPQDVAVHWDGSGAANGFMAPAPAAWTSVLAVLGTGGVCALCFSLNAMQPGLRRAGVGFTVLLTGFLAATFVASFVPQLDEASGAGTVMDWPLVAGVSAPFLVLAVVLSLLVPRTDPETVAAAVPAKGAHVDAAAAARGDTLTVRVSGALLRACARADADGLSVFLWGRWRIAHVPVAAYSFAAADARISPVRYGGWGYRVWPGGSALILRTGPALVLELAGGRTLAVSAKTEEDAGRLAALLNGYKLREGEKHRGDDKHRRDGHA